MDPSLFKTDEETEIRSVEQNWNIHRCFTCGSTNHLRPNCPLRRALQAISGRTPAANQKSGTAQERRLPVGTGCPAGEELGFVEPLGGSSGEKNLASRSPVHSNTGRKYKPGLLVAKATVKGFTKPWSIWATPEHPVIMSGSVPLTRIHVTLRR